MSNKPFSLPYQTDIAWCPGCGNFSIHRILQESLEKAGIEPQKLVISSGIGQAAKMPQYLNCHYFNGLHGRSLPVATAIKACNPELTVIAESGDGCTYGEGGNHFIHTIRRNPDIVNIVHNNMVYGLTKGQGSPTTMKGMPTSLQTHGYELESFNPLAAALSCGAGFVSRICSVFRDQAIKVIGEALNYPGYALVDVLHPCVTFNKLNTIEWYRQNTYRLENHDSSSLDAAMTRALEQDQLPLGIFYRQEKKTFIERSHAYEHNRTPLCQREVDRDKVSRLVSQSG